MLNFMIWSAHDCTLLQKALDVAEVWARDWQLQLSVEKCNVMHIGPCQDNYRYYIGHIEIESKAQCKDLGIVVANDLSPQQHINEMTTKAHRRANSILSLFHIEG